MSIEADYPRKVTLHRPVVSAPDVWGQMGDGVVDQGSPEYEGPWFESRAHAAALLSAFDGEDEQPHPRASVKSEEFVIVSNEDLEVWKASVFEQEDSGYKPARKLDHVKKLGLDELSRQIRVGETPEELEEIFALLDGDGERVISVIEEFFTPLQIDEEGSSDFQKIEDARKKGAIGRALRTVGEPMLETYVGTEGSHYSTKDKKWHLPSDEQGEHGLYQFEGGWHRVDRTTHFVPAGGESKLRWAMTRPQRAYAGPGIEVGMVIQSRLYAHEDSGVVGRIMDIVGDEHGLFFPQA